MAPRPMPWFRFYSESKRDVKITKAARLAGISQMEVIGFWVTLLSIANESPVRGALYVTSHDSHNIDDVTAECNAPIETVKKVMEIFESLEMITVVDGAWHITNWDKRQFSSDKSAERTKKYRNKYQRDNDVTSHDIQCDDDVTPPETETESDPELKDLQVPPPNGRVKNPKKAGKGRDGRLDHPAIMAYKHIVHLQVPVVLRDDVIKAVGDRAGPWATVVKDWVGHGWNPQNISGMLDSFAKQHGEPSKPTEYTETWMDGKLVFVKKDDIPT